MRKSNTSGSSFLNRGTGIDLALITLLSLAVLSPILISPHFGMFSDYGQILLWAKTCVADIPGFFRQLHPLGDGRWNPAFHLLTVGAYAIFGPNAFGYYFLQWLSLALVLAASYLITYKLADNSRFAGWVTCIFILISGPLAESYFTLDKVEPRVLFFAIGSLSLFAWGLLSTGSKPRTSFSIALLFIAQFTLAALNIFSKETGVFIVAVAFAALFVCLIQKKRSRRMILEAAIFFAATLCAYILFKVLFKILTPEETRKMMSENGGVGRYLDYKIDWSLIRGNWNAYSSPLRETILAYIVFGIWCVWELLTGRIRNWDTRKILIFTIGIAGFSYVTGLLFWRWSCLYFMMPAAAFLMIAVVAIAWGGMRHVKIWGPLNLGLLLVITLAIVAETRVSRRWFTANAILAQDKAKDLLIAALDKHVATHPKAIVALFDVNSAEIGESLNTYLNLAGHQGKIRVYNFVEGPWVNFFDSHRYDGSAAEPPTPAEIVEAQKIVGSFIKWKYAPDRAINRAWIVEPFEKGDLILVPTGTNKNGGANARGVSMFSKKLSDYLQGHFDGLSVKVLDEIKVKYPFSRSYLGWDIVEITDFNAIPNTLNGIGNTASEGVNLSPEKVYLGKNWDRMEWDEHDSAYRWGKNFGEIILPKSTGTKTLLLDLEPNTKISTPLPIRIDDANGKKLGLWFLNKRETITLELPDNKGQDMLLKVRTSIAIHVAPDKNCWRLLKIRILYPTKPLQEARH